MKTLEERIVSLEAEIAGYVIERKRSNDKVERKELLHTITASRNVLKNLLDQQSAAGTTGVMALPAPAPAASASQLLALDESASLSDLISAATIGAGDSVSVGNKVHVIPEWLKIRLPMCVNPSRGLIDLSLPLSSNPFYLDMIERMGSSQMMTTLKGASNSRDHILLLGSSGCGKTSACLAMAAEHYMIYLECPSTHGIQAGARGYKMSKKVWSSALAPLTTCDQVVQALYSEIASRLVVLINMIQMHRSNFTPLHWLLYTLSDECSTRVRTLHDKITEQALGVTLGVVQTLQGILQKLLPESSTPVLLVDELQQLAGRDVHNGVASMSLMKAVVQAAALLECAVVWSGTRMGVTAATSQHSGIAKHLENQQLSVVGEFEYLSTDRVKEYLERILSHTASPEMMNQLAYLLQGRARMLTGFIAALFTPDAEAMHCNSPLNDIVLSNTMEKYMETLVVDRFKMEIIGLGKLRGGKGIDYEDLGRIWFLTMLSNHLASTPAVEDTTNRDNSLAFTSRVFEVERTIDQAGKLGIDEPSVEYKFEYIYGEPGLQEALLRMVWQNRALADAGIRSVLRGAITGSTLGSYLDYAVALALISRRSSVLKDLCSGHRVFKRYAEYTLQISRVVCTNQADHQLEWFEKVIADPEDDTFSLLPGVPVRNIAILPSVLSGADIICVAVQGPLGGPPASPTASVPPPPDAQPSPPWTRRRARKLEELAVAPSAVIFAQFCCANYKGGVNSTKHLDQVIKSTDQFSATAERCIAGERYREVAKEHSDKYAYLPILVEIPQYDPDERDEYILITEQNAKVLFSQAVVEVFER